MIVMEKKINEIVGSVEFQGERLNIRAKTNEKGKIEVFWDSGKKISTGLTANSFREILQAIKDSYGARNWYLKFRSLEYWELAKPNFAKTIPNGEHGA
jgi:hypothetical protein